MGDRYEYGGVILWDKENDEPALPSNTPTKEVIEYNGRTIVMWR